MITRTKDERIQVRVDTVEKKSISQDAKTSGHQSSSALLLWLYRNWKSGNLILKGGAS